MRASARNRTAEPQSYRAPEPEQLFCLTLVDLYAVSRFIRYVATYFFSPCFGVYSPFFGHGLYTVGARGVFLAMWTGECMCVYKYENQGNGIRKEPR